MTPILRVILFTFVVASIFGIAFLYLLERIYARLRGRRKPIERFEIVFYALASLGIVCVLYGLLVEPYWPQVTHIKIATAKFPRGSSTVRIVLISDLHTDPKPRADAKIAALIRSEHPDIICFTGDAANVGGEARFRSIMQDLGKIAPVYAVRGNWELPERAAFLYSGLPLHLLGDKAERLTIKGQTVWLGGLHADEIASIDARYPSGNSDFRIFLDHFPDDIQEAKAANVDLYLAGHTHGGQVRLPFYGALVTFSRYDKKYEAGLYHEGSTYMYVTRGVGMEGGKSPRVRFLCRPEVTVIDMVPE